MKRFRLGFVKVVIVVILLFSTEKSAKTTVLTVKRPCGSGFVLATALALIGTMLLARSAHASESVPTALDQCSAIVTGTDMRSRPSGMGRCLIDVLVKVSGDSTLATDPRAEQIATRAAEYAEDFAYFDRMSDVPLHDEQGSRDRPFDLVVHFDPAKVDRALAELGRKPWRSSRPILVVGVVVSDARGNTFGLSADGGAGERQRESLFAAGDRYGLRVMLLPEDAMAAGELSAPDLLAKAKNAIPSESLVPLTGTLRWSEADFGWVARWTLTRAAQTDSWEIRGVSFDQAFRSGVSGAMGLLSTQPR